MKQEFWKKSFEVFDKDWALLTAGEKGGFNSMTVSWGGFGTLWNKPVATVYVLAFFEAGNSWAHASDINPFQVYKSAGVGVRLFLSAMGMFGLDWGYGFDEVPGDPSANGSHFHFSINQSLDW